ncbi:MAG: HAD-IIB family hydrolase [Candidatus Aenigmarchaeota archaeon]|nr:HAD-IIB family hydrolase [Candidatus Aenigmarchaeota archaeon]
MQLIVFTDLDGALLGEDYSYETVKANIEKLKQMKIPIIICTSKTRGEIEIYTNELDIKDPFISENGGAIFIPKNYFSFSFSFDKEDDGYKIIELGTPSESLKDIISKIKKVYNVKCFHEMTAEELARDTGLPMERAVKAQQREYDIAFKIIDIGVEEDIRNLIKESRFQFVKGARYCHLLGNNDKGKAVRLLCDLLRKKYGDIKTMAIGASPNDFPMLDVVDRPYLVRDRNDRHTSEKYIKAWGKGPDGWNYAIRTELKI